MVTAWLKKLERNPSPYTSFNVIDISEQTEQDENLFKYLGKETLSSYRAIGDLKRKFQTKPQEVANYLNNLVFPKLPDRLNVRQGDFGEIITRLMVESFTSLKVPCGKLRLKFNNTKSVFCTDIFAHNQGDTINELKYYEVRTKIQRVEQIAIKAYNDLKKIEEKVPNEHIADYLARQHEHIADQYEAAGLSEQAEQERKIADKYNHIVFNPQKYNRTFELVLIIEKSQFSESLLQLLDAIPPVLSPLSVTVIFIENYKNLVSIAYDKAVEHAEIVVNS